MQSTVRLLGIQLTESHMRHMTDSIRFSTEQNAPSLPFFAHIVLDQVHVGTKPLPETELTAK